MKPPIHSVPQFLRLVGLALLGLLAFPTLSDAKPKTKSGGSGHHDDRHDHAHHVYYSHPRSSFTISFGSGYAGRGYYYGPPGAGYFYERPGVVFYGSHYNAPRYNRDWGYSGYDRAYAVQRALYRRGYYRGPIDGDVGPGTRRAIAQFEADNGLPVRGYVNGPLIDALGLR